MRNLLCSSDMHFSHLNAATKFREFRSVEEHDEFLVERWNDKVGRNDRVIVFGDACMGTITESIKIIGRLNGRISLLPGNHDWTHPAHHGRQDAKASKIERMEALYAEAFDEILPLEFTLPGFFNGEDTTFCHFPPFGDHTAEERFGEFRPHDRGQRFLHGHVHDLWADNDNGRLINVGVDVRGFAPVAIDELLEQYG
jgi:calcineurin-like phosphoesterase family protein